MSISICRIESLILYNLMLAEENQAFLKISYFFPKAISKILFWIRQAIELKMLDQEKRNTSVLKQDFNQMISYHQKFMDLQDLISNTTNLYIQYWEEYLKAKPGIILLYIPLK